MNAQHIWSEAEVSELTDEELAAVSAGAIYMKIDGLDGQVTTHGISVEVGSEVANWVREPSNGADAAN
jgi:hypothetical protein